MSSARREVDCLVTAASTYRVTLTVTSCSPCPAGPFEPVRSITVTYQGVCIWSRTS